MTRTEIDAQRSERRARKEERVQRDKEGNFGGSFALSKHGFEFDFFKPDKNAWMRVHILPFLVQSTNHPEVQMGRMELGEEDYFLQYAQHRGLGSDGRSGVLCLNSTFGKPCPICEHANQLKEQGEKDDLPWPSRRVVYNFLVDGTKIGGQHLIFEASDKYFHRELKGALTRSQRGFFDYSDLDTGAMVECFAEEVKQRYTYLTFKDFKFHDRASLPIETLDWAIPLGALLNVPTYEQVAAFYEGEITTISYDRPAQPEVDNEQRMRPDGTVVDGRDNVSNQLFVNGVPQTDENGNDGQRDGGAEAERSRAPLPNVESERAPSATQEPATATEATPVRGARAAVQEESKGELAYGAACPHGLIYGKDNDTVRKLCGIECQDTMFKNCKAALESHQDGSKFEDDVPF